MMLAFLLISIAQPNSVPENPVSRAAETGGRPFIPLAPAPVCRALALSGNIINVIRTQENAFKTGMVFYV